MKHFSVIVLKMYFCICAYVYLQVYIFPRMYIYMYVFLVVFICDTEIQLEEENSGMPNISVIIVGF